MTLLLLPIAAFAVLTFFLWYGFHLMLTELGEVDRKLACFLKALGIDASPKDTNDAYEEEAR